MSIERLNKPLKIGDRVILKSFLKTMAPSNPVKKNENYWALIGEHGSVVGNEQTFSMPAHAEGTRLLVEFDSKVEGFGLHCHNQIPNTLWIFLYDLQPE